MPSTASSAAAKKITSMKSLQTKLRGLQTSFAKFIQAMDANTKTSQVTVRLGRLDDLWEKNRQRHQRDRVSRGI